MPTAVLCLILGSIIRIRQGPDLMHEIDLEKCSMNFDDFPVRWCQWFDIDGVCARWVKMDEEANLLTF